MKIKDTSEFINTLYIIYDHLVDTGSKRMAERAMDLIIFTRGKDGWVEK